MPADNTATILMVEDDSMVRYIIAEYFRRVGYEVIEATDGEMGLRSGLEKRADVIILDVMMPKMNGFDVCRELRGKPWGREVALVALTGWGQDEDRRRSLQAGFDAHFVKPVDISQLSDFLASLDRARS